MTSTPTNGTSWSRDYRQDYDMDDPELAAHWEDVVEDLHQGCPVSRSKVGEGYLVLNTYDDIQACAKNWELFSSRDGFMPNRPEGMPLWFPVECDPPLHDTLRKALNPLLTPKAIAALEPAMREHIEQIVDGFAGRSGIDVASEFATVVPGTIFCAVVAGMPLADMPYLKDTLHEGLLGPLDKRGAKMQEAQDYMSAYLERRRDEPSRGDIIDAILAIEAEGYDWSARCGTLAQLTLGGFGTSGSVLSSAIHHLALNPDLRHRLIEDPTLMLRAVEEFVRAFAPTVHVGRHLTQDTVVAGTQMHAGEFVMFGYGAASRDPAVVDNPRDIDVTRAPNRHMAFGAGVHRCIGLHQARSQLRIAIEVFLSHYPDFKLAPGFVPSYEQGIERRMSSLPIVFGASLPGGM
jgi:cytochrome P450